MEYTLDHCPVFWDHLNYTRLKQCLVNLLTNAIKYNRENGSVSIAVAAVTEDGKEGRVRISVSDTGAGISLDRQAELFQPFSRLGYENTGIEGTGIGLSITKQLIERMDGAIGCESEVDKGSTFWLELPGEAVDAPMATDTSAPKHENTNAEQSEASSFENKTLLYIEDNPANLSLMEMIISRTGGIDMISAFNAEIGLDMVRS